MNNVTLVIIKKMRNKSLIIALISLFLMSCSFSKKAVNQLEAKKTDEIAFQKNEVESLLLFQQNCYACHSVTSKSHDEIIAPPMEVVKRRYKMYYQTEEEFVQAFTNWVMDPKEENALMRGAIATFNIMPKQPFNEEDINKIAQYIYSNEIEKPDWFQTHFNEVHPNGMGNGQRRGAGNRKF